VRLEGRGSRNERQGSRAEGTGSLDPRPSTLHPSGPAWFCIRSQPKHEHIAASHLKTEEGIEVYLPRIRFKRSTRRGPVWFTEALFPNYLFARFDLAACLRKLHHARGVRGIVHFGDQWPSIPDGVIEELRASLGDEQVYVMDSELQPGENVQISGGAFHGLQAVVTRVMPSRQRVAVLLEFLGRQTMVEVPGQAVIRAGDERQRIL
jgi:transcriptional antiterminator RfaH